jgi:hypothetical protein
MKHLFYKELYISVTGTVVQYPQCDSLMMQHHFILHNHLLCTHPFFPFQAEGHYHG